MPLWQIALAIFALAWALQAFGTYVQMRHYSRVMGEVTRQWSDGFLGAGNARSRFGAGVILLLVVSPDRIVRRVLVMKGRSVFARFARLREVEGVSLETLPGNPALADKAEQGALSVALQQIEKASRPQLSTPAAA